MFSKHFMKIVEILTRRLRVGHALTGPSINNIKNMKIRQNTPAFSVSGKGCVKNVKKEKNVKQLQNVRRSCNMYMKKDNYIFIFIFLVDRIESIQLLCQKNNVILQ